jgi:hypothetical protein
MLFDPFLVESSEFCTVDIIGKKGVLYTSKDTREGCPNLTSRCILNCVILSLEERLRAVEQNKVYFISVDSGAVRGAVY